MREAPLHEIAKAAKAKMADVFDVVNAYDALDLIETRRSATWDPSPETVSKRKRSTTLDIYWGEADDGVDDLELLIDDFLFQQSLGAIYGKYGEGKTFVALDMALSIAAGRPWLGRDVAQGAVLYVAPEGYIGLKQRREAWCKHHRIARDVREDPQFELRVVGRQKFVPLLGNERLSDALTELRADRNILQIRIG